MYYKIQNVLLNQQKQGLEQELALKVKDDKDKDKD